MSLIEPARYVRPLIVAALLSLPACKAKPPSGDEKVAPTRAAPPASPSVRAAVRPDSLKPPPLSAPPDARPISGGGHWKLLHPGKGPGPRPDQQVSADVSVWAPDGKLVETSRTLGLPAGFQLRMLPGELQQVLGQLGPGSSAILWLPPNQVAGFKPPSWPKGEVIIELDTLAVNDDSDPTIQKAEVAAQLPQRGSERAADLGAPPSSAKKTSTGLSYVTRREGTGAKPPNAKARLVTYVSAYALTLRAEPILDNLKMTLTPETAPGGLGEALLTLRTGGLLQIWVPADKAGTVLPGREGTELVLDVYLQSIE